MKTLFGGMLELNDGEDINDVLSKMDKKQVVQLLRIPINYAMKLGIYDLDESFVIHQCLSRINDGQ